MDKKRAIEIITQAASTYQKVFNEKNLLFIYGDEKEPEYLETKSLPRNFLHLTGVDLNKKIVGFTAKKFFYKALDCKLNEGDFDFKKDGTTIQKLGVLCQTLNIKSSVRMIGDYSGNRVKLNTTKLVGGENYFLGFLETRNGYILNTIIDGDIRKDTYYTSRVIGILSKKIEEQYYNEKIYIAKGIDADKLLQALKKDVYISQEILPSGYASPLSSSNVESFSALPPPSVGDAAVLTAPRQTFGQAVREFLKDIVNKVKEIVKRLFRKSDRDTTGTGDTNRGSGNTPSASAQNQEETAGLKSESHELRDERTQPLEQSQKPLVTTAAPKKTFNQGLDEFAKRPRALGSPKPPVQNIANKKHHKD